MRDFLYSSLYLNDQETLTIRSFNHCRHLLSNVMILVVFLKVSFLFLFFFFGGLILMKNTDCARVIKVLYERINIWRTIIIINFGYCWKFFES